MPDPSSEVNPLDQLAEEFVERYRRGERPPLTEYIKHHPELESEIRSLFPGLVLMEGIRPETGEATGAYASTSSESRRPERIGDYRILREVGRGGMGIVYEAEQESLGRHVALKVLPSHALIDAKHLQRFQREARAAAKLHHTNIVPVYGVGHDDGLHYYVMQFIPGQGLDQVLAELKRLRHVPEAAPAGSGGTGAMSAGAVAQALLTGEFQASGRRQPAGSPPDRPANAGRSPEVDTSIHLPGQSSPSTLSDTGRAYWQSVARVGIQVADALAYAHGQGTLHRDIKPSNLLLDGDGIVWVTDFGLAKATADTENLTHTGDIVGTLRYMAPERFQGQSDARGDIYALGLTLYELLTLRPAFSAGDRNQLIQQVLHDQPARPRKLNPVVPHDLETIVLKAIDRDPAHRYPTAAQLTDDLRRFVEDRPIQARRVSARERLWRWCRRNPMMASLTATVLGLLAMVAVVASVGYMQTTLALTREAEQRAAAEAAEGRANDEAERARAAWYAASINVMQLAWDTGQIARLRELLKETEAYPDRGFEWYYWQRLCHLELRTLVGHCGVVWSVSWSPDGKRLATGSVDGTAKVWEAASGRELLTLKGHTGAVFSVSWSPDGKRLATTSDDRTVKVWDLAGGSKPLTLKGHTKSVTCVSWSRDSKRLATGSFEPYSASGEVIVWDRTRGNELLTLPTNPILSVSWSPDGDRLAAASVGGTTKVWRVPSGRELLTFQAHPTAVRSVSWSPDGRQLATGAADGSAKVWEANGGELRTLKGHMGAVLSVCWSPDGKRLATGSLDGMAKTWEAASGQELLSLKGHTYPVVSVSWSPDGQWLATASEDGTAKVWEATDARQQRTIERNTSDILCVSWSPDGNRIALGTEDGTTMVRELASGLKTELERQKVPIKALAWSPDGKRLATGSGSWVMDAPERGAAKVWDVESGREVCTLGPPSIIPSLSWSPDGHWLATGSGDGTVRVWDVASGRRIFALDGHPNEVICMSWSPDGRRLATGSPDRTVKVWDMADGRELLTLNCGDGYARSVAWSPNGQQLATACIDRTAKVWDAASGRVLLTLKGHSGSPQSLSWSPDGRRLVTASSDGTAKVWEAASGRELLTLKGHTSVVRSVSWSPDGQRLATGSLDGTVKVWERANEETRQEWVRQERVLEDLLTRNDFRGPKAQGFIRDWLLLLPVPFGFGKGVPVLATSTIGLMGSPLLQGPLLAASALIPETGEQGLDLQQLPREAQLRPKPGERVQVAGKELVWQEYRCPETETVLNFNAVLGHVTEWSVAYAVCYLECDRPRQDLWLQVASDDQGKVYLNGREIYQCRRTRELEWLDTVGPVELRQGTNVLVFKVVNQLGGWDGCVRLVDDEGRPAKGIKVKLAPEP